MPKTKNAGKSSVFPMLLVNSAIATITNFTVWFALTYFVFLQTKAVLATSVLSGLYLVATSTSGIWFGSIVDHNRKKNVMLASSILSATLFAFGFGLFQLNDISAFQSITSPILWIFVVSLLAGVIAGNLRMIALPTLVTLLIPENERDKANGMVGMISGVSFMVVSVISGALMGFAGMFWVLVLALLLTMVTLGHLFFLHIPEKEIMHVEGAQKNVDLAGTYKVVKNIPGLMALILFTTINNFLGGVFMSLMDAYGLSLVSVQVWGIIWGVLSLGFIVGGAAISKFGLGKSPVRSLFLANFVIWTVSSLFTLHSSMILLMAGMFVYLCVVPYIEASEHTIMQKVVPPERQGRVFGFAQSVEQAASPVTAFAIGPLAQFFFIPFMSEGGEGAKLIGSWFGVGPDRGIALVFTLAGLLGLTLTTLASRSRFAKQLTTSYHK